MVEVNVEKIMDEIRAEAQKHHREPIPEFVTTAAPDISMVAQDEDHREMIDEVYDDIYVLLNPNEENYYGVTGGGIKGKIRRFLRRLSNGSVAPLRVHTGATLGKMHRLLVKVDSENGLMSAGVDQLNLYLDEEREKRMLLERKVSELERKIAELTAAVPAKEKEA